jgi:hypothetical protein
MIIILLLLALILLVLIAMYLQKESCKKPVITSDDHRNIGVSRMVWGIVFLVLGIAFPPLWIIAFFLIIYAFAFFKKAKTLH